MSSGIITMRNNSYLEEPNLKHVGVNYDWFKNASISQQQTTIAITYDKASDIFRDMVNVNYDFENKGFPTPQPPPPVTTTTNTSPSIINNFPPAIPVPSVTLQNGKKIPATAVAAYSTIPPSSSSTQLGLTQVVVDLSTIPDGINLCLDGGSTFSPNSKKLMFWGNKYLRKSGISSNTLVTFFDLNINRYVFVSNSDLNNASTQDLIKDVFKLDPLNNFNPLSPSQPSSSSSLSSTGNNNNNNNNGPTGSPIVSPRVSISSPPTSPTVSPRSVVLPTIKVAKGTSTNIIQESSITFVEEGINTTVNEFRDGDEEMEIKINFASFIDDQQNPVSIPFGSVQIGNNGNLLLMWGDEGLNTATIEMEKIPKERRIILCAKNGSIFEFHKILDEEGNSRTPTKKNFTSNFRDGLFKDIAADVV